jgi:hypothetical protein
VSVACAALWTASFSFLFRPFFLALSGPALGGGSVDSYIGSGSTAFPARLAKAACLPAEGVVKGLACWAQTGDDGMRPDGLQRDLPATT